jgi:hypothetical protein
MRPDLRRFLAAMVLCAAAGGSAGVILPRPAASPPAASVTVSLALTLVVASADGAAVTAPGSGQIITADGAVWTLGATTDAAGAVVSTAAVTMSKAGARFTGVLVSSSPFYAINGMNVVLPRNLTPADDGAHNTTITAYD